MLKNKLKKNSKINIFIFSIQAYIAFLPNFSINDWFSWELHKDGRTRKSILFIKNNLQFVNNDSYRYIYCENNLQNIY